MNGCNNLTLNNNPSLAARQRLRWTHELHERFVEAVAQLGGPDRYYGKDLYLYAELVRMLNEILNSDVQRLDDLVEKSDNFNWKKADKKDSGDLLSSLDGSSGMQITEALKLQMEVQKRLHEQLEVQRQLQLRIEAQGKYLKKIIEEQHRLSGVLSEDPGSGLSAPASNDNWPASDIKTDPATPAPTSETPLLDKNAKENALAKSISIDESFSSRHEPLTPDSGCHSSSPDESPKGVRSAKKQRVSMDAAYSIPETVLTQRILDSSCSPPYKQPHSLFLAREQ
ncbi:hypothetical protein RHSIM_Rhsim02G0087800 [Rhododendron simsii]|uniref:MYB-CC type transcription factor LHEQLE-containing domain-containing protein n=1 Tax=Rhododendron simsii TaxID=118357 RepID=A0A834HNZ1_RHOSS|nr:hypothetical protein RHSIM_Rhsim02G0087800 [Rhododendron simsii]